MKLYLMLAARNNGDGSIAVKIVNDILEGLNWLGKTKEDLERGVPYDDGMMEPIEIELDQDGVINSPSIELDAIA